MRRKIKDEVGEILREEGLPNRPCGLSADWVVQAWHLGPSDEPNKNDGDWYLVDDETGDEKTYSLVQRFYTLDGDVREDSGAYDEEYHTLIEAIDLWWTLKKHEGLK